ncbi:hypothetical protein [Nocardioides sp. SYSU D00038]|uniref:hypothetical protein n=1 Tax=Nocardioides sp. SYSU D00038 TaxID=2812554 RepID=UPI00196749E4|nr:hypothetical protein [Nocardioides sp. SYSU D00038]
MLDRLDRLRAAAATALVAAVVGVPLVAPAGPAAAAPTGPCPQQTVQDGTRGARAVFIGTVEESTREDRTGGQRGATFDHVVTVSRVYRGSLTSDARVRTDITPGQCSLGRLTTGEEYVFMVVGDGNPWVAVGTSGTAPATARLVAQVERLLGAGDPAVAPTPEAAEITRVADAEPRSFSRLAAPGFALVLLGLLGLVVVRGLGSRR